MARGHLEFWFPDDDLKKTSPIDSIFLEYNGDAQEKFPFDFWCDPTSGAIRLLDMAAILNLVSD
jgi:hypothetical protein